MFDIGFTEIILVFIVTLLVVGPERLPRLARTAGLWLGKMRGFVSAIKADIDRELATEELKKALAKQVSVPELEELVDEVTGKPLQAPDHTPRKAVAGGNSESPAGPVDHEQQQ
jgi:sec-independent protein translocase protein TatB